MADYIQYQVKLTTISPLHIGSGRVLLQDYDYAVKKGYTWRLNEDTLLDAQQVEDPRVLQKLMSSPPGHLLGEQDFTDQNPFFRYFIRGIPRSDQTGAELREQLKNSLDQPFIPGSSIKGALRTILAWKIAQLTKLDPARMELDRKREWAARNVERKLLVDPNARRGHEPNYDLLRSLQVSDSLPLPASCLTLINVTVLNRGGTAGAPIELEAIKPDTTFTLTIKVDTALFSQWARRMGLNLPHTDLLTKLPEVINERARIQVNQEFDWYQKINGAQRVAEFYQQLQQAQLGSNRALIQVGWGAGWHNKTLDNVLTINARFMDTIIRDYRMSRGNRHSGDPFPKSRRVVILTQKQPDGRTFATPVRPMGWLLVEF